MNSSRMSRLLSIAQRIDKEGLTEQALGLYRAYYVMRGYDTDVAFGLAVSHQRQDRDPNMDDAACSCPIIMERDEECIPGPHHVDESCDLWRPR